MSKAQIQYQILDNALKNVLQRKKVSQKQAAASHVREGYWDLDDHLSPPFIHAWKHMFRQGLVECGQMLAFRACMHA